jgi:flagellar motor switch/type III secretory pathway protein FliN
MAAEGSLARAGEERRAEDVGKASEPEEDARWKPVLGLPCQLMVDLPLPGFTIADLLKLRPGSVIDARWRVGHDVALLLNGTPIAWIEFELVDNSLGVRVIELV